MHKNQNGSLHLALIGAVIVFSAVGFAAWRVYNKNYSDSKNSTRQTGTPNTTSNTSESADTPKTQDEAVIAKEPDSSDTLAAPQTITSADGKTYFVYGAPAGQNNTSQKKIIISLPGHGTTADDGYKAWSQHITGGNYALAEFNWWRGTGEKKTDYYSPTEVVRETRAFLNAQGYTSGDIVILHGFSRGSANTYAVIAQDKLVPGSVFDAVISNAGKYQSDFPLSDTPLSDAEISRLFKNVPWVLACGGKDDNPNRDGCPGMAETESFLKNHSATVLGTVSDPNGGHGAFHMSSLGLPKQALQLIENAL